MNVAEVPEEDVTLEFVISSRHRGSGVGGCAMKITLDISKLVEEGKLTREEADKLTALAAHDTGSLGVNILIGFGVVAIAAGAVALVPTPLTAVGLGLALFAAGCAIVLACLPLALRSASLTERLTSCPSLNVRPGGEPAAISD